MASPIILLPWDPSNPEHLSRIEALQVSMAWFPPSTTQWAEQQARGQRQFYFICLVSSHAAYKSLLARHAAKYPDEAVPIASSIGPLVPVGQLALGLLPESLCQKLKLQEGSLRLTSLYVSWALQSTGVGAAAVDAANALARESGAPSTALETITSRWQDQEAYLALMYDGRGLARPGRSNEDWYARRGYKRIEGSMHVIDSEVPELKGDLARVELVWMEKRL